MTSHAAAVARGRLHHGLVLCVSGRVEGTLHELRSVM